MAGESCQNSAARTSCYNCLEGVRPVERRGVVCELEGARLVEWRGVASRGGALRRVIDYKYAYTRMYNLRLSGGMIRRVEGSGTKRRNVSSSGG